MKTPAPKSLPEVCAAMGITMTVKKGAPPNPHFKDATGYACTLKYQGRKMSTPFYMGPAHSAPPEVADVVSCLIQDMTSVENASCFEEWARDLGYDPDSRKAFALYEVVRRQAAKTRALFGKAVEALIDAASNY